MRAKKVRENLLTRHPAWFRCIAGGFLVMELVFFASSWTFGVSLDSRGDILLECGFGSKAGASVWVIVTVIMVA